MEKRKGARARGCALSPGSKARICLDAGAEAYWQQAWSNRRLNAQKRREPLVLLLKTYTHTHTQKKSE